MAFDYEHMSKEKIASLYKDDSKFVTDTLYNYISKRQAEEKAEKQEQQFISPELNPEDLPFG